MKGKLGDLVIISDVLTSHVTHLMHGVCDTLCLQSLSSATWIRVEWVSKRMCQEKDEPGELKGNQ